MKTRVLSFLLVLCMVLTLLPGAALAADEQPAQLVELEANGGHLFLNTETGTIEKCEANVKSAVIPASVELESEAEEGEEPVTNVVEIKAVGAKAFAGCTELTEVYFEGAPSIADDAFEGVTVTVYYPIADKKVWKDKTTSYGGELTWDTWCPEHMIKLPHIDKEPTCTENGQKTGVCSYCKEVVTVEIPALGHEFGDWETTTVPTCTEAGEKMHQCSRCELIEVQAVKPTGHSENTEWKIDKEATCTEEGLRSGHCPDCDADVTEVIPMIQHTYGEWTVVKEPTCTENGEQQKVCSVCKAVESEAIEATGHDWAKIENASFDATCTEDGKLVQYCTVCGAYENEVIPALGHKTEVVGAKDATCTEDGYTGDVVCTICKDKDDNALVIEKGELIPALGHKVSADARWNLTKAPTCDKVGTETCTEKCSVCNGTVTRDIPKTEHHVEAWTVFEPATCTQDGRCVGRCVDCKNYIEEVIPALGHTPADERVDTKDATCTEEGYTGDVVCSVCGEVIEKGEVISALGHKTEIVGAKDATCTEAGYTGDVVCSVCGEVIEKGEVIPALGHKTELVGAKDATCTEAGYTGDVVCSVCGEVIEKGEVISALGHKTEIVGAKDATCTEAGYTGDEVCSVCGEVIEKGEVIAALGHTPADERVDAKAATCTEAGYTGDEVCTVCGEVIEKGEAIAALGHDYKDGVCTVCGAEDPNYKPAEYPFTDVDVDGKHAPFADAILWAANEGITTGYGDSIFKPDANCTRAQVVTFLWRAAGSPTPKSTDNPFVDVAAKQANGKDNPYYTAILWAVSEGITLGVDSTHFAPDATVTRAQFVTFLWRYENKPAAKPGVTLKDLGTVTNADFKSAILWAAGEGITTGYADGSFRPNAVCTRAHVVTFIYRDMT